MNMKCRSYSDDDYEVISGWYKARLLTVPEKDYLPKVGFIVDDIACGFIYKTDSLIAILDMYVTNPHASDIDRKKALEMVTTLLICHAQACHLKAIKADTKYDAIKLLAMEHGFNYLGEYSSFFKEI